MKLKVLFLILSLMVSNRICLMENDLQISGINKNSFSYVNKNNNNEITTNDVASLHHEKLKQIVSSAEKEKNFSLQLTCLREIVRRSSLEKNKKLFLSLDSEQKKNWNPFNLNNVQQQLVAALLVKPSLNYGYGKRVEKISEHPWIKGISYSPDGSQLAVGIHSGPIYIYNSEMLRLQKCIVDEDGNKKSRNIGSLQFSPSGKHLVVGNYCYESPIHIYDASNFSLLHKIKNPNHIANYEYRSHEYAGSESPYSLVYNKDGSQLACGGQRKIFIFDTNENKLTNCIECNTDKFVHKELAVAYNNDDKLLIAGSDNEISIFDTNTNKLIHVINEFNGGGNMWGQKKIVCNPATSHLACCISEVWKCLRIFDLRTLGMIFNESYGDVESVAYNPAGNQLALCVNGYARREITLIDAENFKPIQTVDLTEKNELNNVSINQIAYNPNGKQIAGASYSYDDSSVHVFNVHSLNTVSEAMEDLTSKNKKSYN